MNWNWTDPGLAQGRPTSDSVVFGNLNSAFEIGHKYDSKRFCAFNYHSWKFVFIRISLSYFFMVILLLFFLSQIKAGKFENFRNACALNYHSWKFVRIKMLLSCFFIAILKVGRLTFLLEKRKIVQKWAHFQKSLNPLTPRCRTPKVSKIGAFSQYLRVTTFWDLKIYTQKYMTLRDFDNFLFFPWIFWFLCASLHATVFAKKWCKTKWSCFYINERAFVILITFCVKKHYFS